MIRTRFSNKFVVYQLYCKSNDTSYIGITNNFRSRLAVHWNCFTKTVLSRTIKKYGKNNFVVFELEKADCWDTACEKEMFYIDKYNTRAPNGMNMTDGGEGAFGLVHSEKTRKQMSESHKGLFAGRKNPMYGKPGAMLGKTWTDKQRKSFSEFCMGRTPWNKGKKEAQKAWNKGKTGIYSEETLKALSEGRKGKRASKEVRMRMSLNRRGEKNSNSKLTESKVISIRKIYQNREMTQKRLAEKYGVTPTMINNIIKNRAWTSI